MVILEMARETANVLVGECEESTDQDLLTATLHFSPIPRRSIVFELSPWVAVLLGYKVEIEVLYSRDVHQDTNIDIGNSMK